VTYSSGLQAVLIGAAVLILLGAVGAMAWVRRPRR
jgi:hypothetical protein